MVQRRALGGLSALLLLAVTAIAAVILGVALIDSGRQPVSFTRVQPDDTPLIRIEDRVITRFHVRVAEQYHKLRAGKDGFVLPEHGILLQFIQLAAWEEILRKHGRAPTPQQIADERARQIRESRDPAKMRDVIGLLDQYPGMFEMLLVRMHIANQNIYRLHGDRQVQGEAYERAERGLKEALGDPDYFRKNKEADPESYRRIDSDDPLASIKAAPLPPTPDELPKKEKEVAQKHILDFAKRHLSTTTPGDVCSTVVDEEGSYLVLRLLERTADRVVYECVAYRKTMYDVWFEAELKKLKAEVPDAATRKLLAEHVKDLVWGRWLLPQ